jgi:cell division inhibitor SepF
MKFDFKSFIGDDKKSPDKKEDEYYETNEGFKDMVGGAQMILMEPRAYSESQQIADYLKKRCSVVVNLKRVTPEVAKRIVDFLGGTIYAIGGTMQKLGNGIFLCAPNNFNVEGKISEGEKGSKSKKEENELDW